MFSNDFCETFLNMFFIEHFVGLKNLCLHVEYPVKLETLLLVKHSNRLTETIALTICYGRAYRKEIGNYMIAFEISHCYELFNWFYPDNALLLGIIQFVLL